MNDTEIQSQGKELRGLAKLLFDRAALLWYFAMGLDIFATVLSVVGSLWAERDADASKFAIAGFALIALAYALRIAFERTYDHAETMRRQSVFTEGMGWTISALQFSEWRRLAGDRVLNKLEKQGVDANYYDSVESVGSRRLLAMVIESAFWTRHLYSRLQLWLWIVFVVSISGFLGVLTFVADGALSESLSQKLVTATYLLLPVIVTLNTLGFALRLGRLVGSIKDIERDLERTGEEATPADTELLRLVAEYNCQLTSGFPIPSWFYRIQKNSIDSLWKKRSNS